MRILHKIDARTVLPLVAIALLAFVGIAWAQYPSGDSVLISISMTSCPMIFEIDSLTLPYHPIIPGYPQQDTFFLNDIYSTPQLDWDATYMVGNGEILFGLSDSSEGLLVRNIGCVFLDFDLSTYGVRLADWGPWWVPNDSLVHQISEYILRCIATGPGTDFVARDDSLKFKRPESYYHIVPDTGAPKEITNIPVSDSAICCFYSGALYGYDLIPTISDSGLALPGKSEPDSLLREFRLHIALTTPREVGADTHSVERQGYIILEIKAKPSWGP